MTARVLPQQSIFDIAIIRCGSIEAAFTLAMRNNLSLTDTLTDLSEIEYSASDIIDKKTVEKYTLGKYQPATVAQSSGEGIGYWAIGIDFTVQ